MGVGWFFVSVSAFAHTEITANIKLPNMGENLMGGAGKKGAKRPAKKGRRGGGSCIYCIFIIDYYYYGMHPTT
jgi:hypothetical protein